MQKERDKMKRMGEIKKREDEIDRALKLQI